MRFFFTSLFKILFYPVFWVNMAMLGISLLSALIDPKYLWLPALIKLLFPVWLSLHIIFLIIFLYTRKKRKVIIAGLLLLLSLSGITKSVALHPQNKSAEKGKKELRIMTYNVMGFHWWHKRNASKILHIIKDEEPDIICFQEYLMNKKDRLKIRDTLRKVYDYKYSRQHFILTLPYENYQFGLAIYSRLPLKNFTPIYFDNAYSNGAFYVDVPNKKDTFRLINVHFESFGLMPNEYKMIDSLHELNEKKFAVLKQSVKKLRSGFRKKSFQMEQIRKIIKESPYKVVLCGDFNDTPLAYVYSELTEELDDAFLECGSGFGSTFISKFPLLRIDYILTDPRLKPLKTYVVKKKASDHYPVVSDISFEDKPEEAE